MTLPEAVALGVGVTVFIPLTIFAAVYIYFDAGPPLNTDDFDDL